MANNIITYIILTLLGLDTIRALVAMLGWVKPDKKYAWLFYGRYERILIHTALKEIGFDEAKTDSIIKKMKEIPKQIPLITGIKKGEAQYHLALLLANYIVSFSKQIQYGGKSVTGSNYYIDTMEISHNKEDLRDLSNIMRYLINKNLRKIPDIMIVPKGGNPLLAQAVANSLGSHLIVAKSTNDKSRMIIDEDSYEDYFRINYEGSWRVLNSESTLNCIVLDCNTSGGSQLLEIIEDLSRITASSRLKISRPDKAFVLFRADNQGEDIDKKFDDHKCELIRFFDLDESMKNELYKIRNECTPDSGKLSYFVDDHRKRAIGFIKTLLKRGKCYYKGN